MHFSNSFLSRSRFGIDIVSSISSYSIWNRFIVDGKDRFITSRTCFPLRDEINRFGIEYFSIEYLEVNKFRVNKFGGLRIWNTCSNYSNPD
jgi:hypothetical protein